MSSIRLLVMNVDYFLLFLTIFAINFKVVILSIDKNSEINYDEVLKDDFIDEPIQLVRPDTEHKKLELVRENVKLLHKIKGPVATVAVVGKFHSGKSFLMNQLMRKSNGFGIGPHVQPKTMGIWMWGNPIQFTLSSGLKVSLIFLDTEGFAANNVSENYDAKIFAVATLLSSHLLYNSVKIIDQGDIDYLELLARRTQLFALRSQLSRAKWTSELNKDLLTFPPLTWVVQDFVQNIEESPSAWLSRLMHTHTRENELYEISLRDIFKSVDCHTLFIPAVKRDILADLSQARESDLTEEYKQERNSLINKLKSEIVPKEKNNHPVSGVQLATLLEILVEAANDGSLADVPNRWDSFVNRLQTTATEDCLKLYEADMTFFLSDTHNNDPVSVPEFDHWHTQSLTRSRQLLEHLLHGLDDALDRGLQSLEYNINISYQRAREINEKKIKFKCSQLQQQTDIKAEELLTKYDLPVLSSLLVREIKRIKEQLINDYVVQVQHLVDSDTIESHRQIINKSIKNLASSIILENNKEIENFFHNHIDQAVDKFVTITSSDYSRVKPRSPVLLQKILTAGSDQAVTYFQHNTERFVDESLYKSHLAVLKHTLTDRSSEIVSENEHIADSYVKSQLTLLVDKFKDRTSQTYIALPINNTDLDSRLKVEITRVLFDYDDMFHDFNTYTLYQTNLQELKVKIGQVCDLRRSENVKAFTKEVSIPLQTAKKTIMLSAEKYSTVFSLKLFMRSVCLLQLDEGKPKYWSVKLKSEIIEQFINDDTELADLIKSREGLWSTLVGFFQWILWLFSFG